VQVGPPSGGILDQTLQDAIDLAGANDLLLVKPGTYREMVVMWKPIQLQGYGEGSTTINALKSPSNKLEIWRGLVDGLITGNDVDLLPGQEVGGGAPEPSTLWTEEGAGILVLAKNTGPSAPADPSGDNLYARIDGFTIKSADTGGGIVVNGYTDTLDISNNRVANNSGFYGGGIRVGHPILTNEAGGGGLSYTDAQNDYVAIHHNQVVFNGGRGGTGGGVSMCTGADSYAITENWVCGNFTLGNGGGIGHAGVSDGVWTGEDLTELPKVCSLGDTPDGGCSDDGECVDDQGQNICVFQTEWVLTDAPLIAYNTIIFNENFNQGLTVSGGGLYIGGQRSLAPQTGQCLIPPAEITCTSNADCAIPDEGGLGGECEEIDPDTGVGLCSIQPDNECLALADCPGTGNACLFTPAPSPGSGSVQVLANLIQGNSAAVGDGGGIRLAMVNGEDVAALPYNTVDLFNNMIVNNVAGLAGGGISLQDAVDVRIVHNTIANNDSLATAGEAFAPNSPNESTPQPGAGIVTRTHSSVLAAMDTSLCSAGKVDESCLVDTDCDTGDGTGDGVCRYVGTFSDPSAFADNIIWQNRRFFFKIAEGIPGDPAEPSVYGLCPDIGGAIVGLDCPGNDPVYDDLAVIGAGTLECDPSASCILTGGTNPAFVEEYVNANRSAVFQPEITTAIQVPPAFDEGGNFIRPTFGPLSLYNDDMGLGIPGTLFGDYHISVGTAWGIYLGDTFLELLLDFDNDARMNPPDIGADELP
jgi:hypothetical protein